jgi:hypothetical protein
MQVARLGLPRRPSKGAGLEPSNLGLLHEVIFPHHSARVSVRCPTIQAMGCPIACGWNPETRSTLGAREGRGE